MNDEMGIVEHDYEKSDIFSLGITMLQYALNLSLPDIRNMNEIEGGEEKINA